MSWEIIVLVTFGLVIVILFMGAPVFAGLGLAAMLSAWIFIGSTGVIEYVFWNVSNSFILTAIPLFMFMGQVLLQGGLSDYLYSGSAALVGRLPGGLLHANIASCAIFAAACGSSTATAATVGTVAIPALEARGYEHKIVLGSLAGGGTLGLLIPPSGALIIYGVLVNESIGALFIAGIIPGIMLALLFMIYILVRVVLQPGLAPAYEKVPLKRRIVSILNMWTIAIIIVVILGGIYLGVMTPTEAAAAGVTLALLFSIGYRKMTWQTLQRCMLNTVKLSTMVLFIVITASMIGGTLGLLQVPRDMVNWVLSAHLPPLVILMLIYFMYICLGCFFEGISMMVLTMAVIFPIIVSLGYDPIWFGIVLVVLIEMAQITPPVGLNLYTIHALCPDRPMGEVIRGSMPFFLIMLLALIILTAFPIIATWLPATMPVVK